MAISPSINVSSRTPSKCSDGFSSRSDKSFESALPSALSSTKPIGCDKCESDTVVLVSSELESPVVDIDDFISPARAEPNPRYWKDGNCAAMDRY